MFHTYKQNWIGYFWIFLVLPLLFLAYGCTQKNEEIELLKRENPFRTARIEPAKPKTILTCQFYPVELPGAVTLSSLLEPDSATGQQESARKDLSNKPFGGEKGALWRKNGLDIFLVSGEVWPELSQKFNQSGGRMLSQTTAMFRTPDEQANFSTYARYETTSLFINEGKNALRGYTLGEGACLFRMTCVPDQFDQEPNFFNITIVPVFESGYMEESYQRDEFGNIRRIRNRQEVPFNELKLSGQVPPDSFLCVVSRPAGHSVNTVGSMFLRQTQAAQNIQMMCIFIPRLQIMQPADKDWTTTPTEK